MKPHLTAAQIRYMIAIQHQTKLANHQHDINVEQSKIALPLIKKCV